MVNTILAMSWNNGMNTAYMKGARTTRNAKAFWFRLDKQRINHMKKGLTLVEVVIAIAIMGISLGTFLTCLTRCKSAAAAAALHMTALQEARTQMEKLQTDYFGQLPVGTFSSKWYRTEYPSSSSAIIITNDWFYKVSYAPKFSNSVKDIAVTVRWRNPGSKSNLSVTLSGSVSSELHQP